LGEARDLGLLAREQLGELDAVRPDHARHGLEGFAPRGRGGLGPGRLRFLCGY
jgi:hypothetical protein